MAVKQTQAHSPAFAAGDIVFFGSTGDLVSKLSRWFMRGEHEAPTYAVHTGQFLDANRVIEMDMLVRVESFDDLLRKRYWSGPFRSLMPPPAWAQIYGLLNRRYMRYRRYWQPLWKPRSFEVWRCRTLSDAQRTALTREALKYVNVKFGFARLTAHLLDDLLCKLLRRDVFLFRSMDPADRHPVCSGVTSTVYDNALHYRFGVEPQCADPDQIHDWVSARPDEWALVFRFGPPRAQKGEVEMLTKTPTATARARISAEQVWRELDRASFAVISYVTPTGEPRSSGVVYKTVGRRLYLAVGPDSWKARHIKLSGRVAVTVPVRRGGILALLFPIPPATISFHAQAIVHPAGEVAAAALSQALAALLPPDRRADNCIIELLPEGEFLTYGIGVTLAEMRNPANAKAHAPTS